MAATDRASASALAALEALLKEPARYDFFQAVRIIDCAYPNRPRTGTASRPSQEAIRFGVPPELTFAPGTITEVKARDGRPPWMGVRMMGLTGPNGALPIHLTEWARERQRHHGDGTMAAFLDMFHHRMVAFFYRAWAEGKPVVALDRPERDRFTPKVAALQGIGMPAMRNRDRLPDFARLFFSGRFADTVANPDGLQAMVRRLFGVPAQVLEFVGRWMHLPRDTQTRLGGGADVAALGLTAILGERVWGVQQTFVLRLGPLTLERYRRFLPGGPDLAVLTSLLRAYPGDRLDAEVNLVLKAEEVPPLALDGSLGLGHTTWLTGRTGPDADDLQLHALTLAAA